MPVFVFEEKMRDIARLGCHIPTPRCGYQESDIMHKLEKAAHLRTSDMHRLAQDVPNPGHAAQ